MRVPPVPSDLPTDGPTRSRAPRLARVAAAALVVVLSACAGPPVLSDDALRERLPSLEARAATAPDDPGVLLDLGRAYVQLGLYGRARPPLTRAERIAPANAEAYALLGVLEEGLGHRAEALARYQDAPPAVAAHPALGPWVEGRAVWLRREVAYADVAAALDAETYPDEVGDAVVVFPFAAAGAPDADLWGRALAALAADALASAGAPVVDGDRVAALLREIGVAPDALAPDRARRLGHLLRARYVLLGDVAVDGDSVRTEATLWSRHLDAPQVQVVQAVALRDLASVLPLLVERVALGLDVAPPGGASPLPPSLDALLHLGAGLRADDAGRPEDAAAHYAAAARPPAGLPLADARRQQAERLLLAGGPLPQALASLAALARPSAPGPDLMHRRLAALNATLGGHAVPGEEARAPRADSQARPRPTTPFPLPPPPPTGGTDGPPGNRP